ncbi:MAG TPA: bifunctional phosphopantothenoylcysteine decarboxylase/phosphopantothenate--cysteine ligase CoaBC [Rhodothermales bacterium]|nr:bifunctional phosphopantothenoylcysteine decarboxylase/phosphopantothenate--cysteine ligase CoaBC [Rhodothermales bacterium]
MSTQNKTLTGRKLLLGVTGSIAAYKAAELVRLLKKSGADVQVLMTADAARFITPLTLGTLSEREILTEIFPENEAGSWTKHVHLGLWADLFVIAPASAQTIARLANGFCDSMLTATALAARCPILVCPAMDHDMYRHPATQANLERLSSFGYEIVQPGYGELASGLTGTGRLPEPDEILERVREKLADSGASGSPLAGKTVLVTAGPTREALDPVRYLTNHSSGRMGYALAEAARRLGASVTLVSGPTGLDAPAGVERIDVTSAQEMHEAVQAHKNADVVIAAAAVADYAPAEMSPTKIKKGGEELVLQLRRTPDVLRALGEQKRPAQVLVGFALETDDGLAHARQKLEAKHLDLIVLNNPLEAGAGFGTATNRVTLIGPNGRVEELPMMSKQDVAKAILERVAVLVGR